MDRRLREQDFDMLENDQIAIQGMLLSRFVGHFEAEVCTYLCEVDAMNFLLRLHFHEI